MDSSTDDVPVYNSTISELDESDEETMPAKRRRINNDWAFEQTFTSLSEAEAALKEDGKWSRCRTNKTEVGTKIYFRCSYVKRRGTQCPAAVYLLLQSTQSDVSLFRTAGNHIHKEISSADFGIPDPIKEVISELFNQQQKAKAILKILGDKGLELPTKTKLNNYISFLRRKNYGPSTISLGELHAWLQSRSKTPSNAHESFVIGQNVDFNAESFQFAISTTHLLSNLKHSTFLHADATYKIVWQGFPVLVVGVTDRDRHFHVISLAVTTNEKAEDFEFIFRAIQTAAEIHNGKTFVPDVLICDAAKAIQNGFQEVFGHDPCIRMCWAHVKSKLQKSIGSRCSSSKTGEQILLDVDLLQLACDSTVFDSAAEAFLQKWAKEEKFCDYFDNEWLKQNRNWFEGATEMRSPSTNNALEAFNRVVKDCGTMRTRFPLGQFLSVSSSLVTEWSSEYIGQKKFIHEPTITLKLWTKAYQWVKTTKEKKILCIK